MPGLPKLIAAVAFIVVVSLSIHVVMLQVLWVPYPSMQGVGRWAQLYPLAQALGLVWLAAATAPRLARFHPSLRWLIVATLFGTMNGIVRNALMEGVVTTDYVAPLAGFLRTALIDFVLAGLAVTTVRFLRHPVTRALAAVAIAMVTLRLIGPALDGAIAPLTDWLAGFARPETYQPPYGPNVLIPSYLSFAETVVACLVARWLVDFRVARWDPKGLVRYALIVLLVRGTLVMMVVFGPLIGADPAAGMLSASQFFLQDLAMVLMIQAVLVRTMRRG